MWMLWISEISPSWNEAKLRRLIPRTPSSVLYLDHINGKGVEFFEMACKLDLRGSGSQAEAEPLPQARRKAAVGEGEEPAVLAGGGAGGVLQPATVTLL